MWEHHIKITGKGESREAASAEVVKTVAIMGEQTLSMFRNKTDNAWVHASCCAIAGAAFLPVVHWVFGKGYGFQPGDIGMIALMTVSLAWGYALARADTKAAFRRARTISAAVISIKEQQGSAEE